MHFCNQCGRELSHREKFCKHCGTRIEYLCALPPFPPGPDKRRELRKPSSIGKWILVYLLSMVAVFIFSYFYYSSTDLQTWSLSPKKSESKTVQPERSTATPAPAATNPTVILKSAYNQFSIAVQKSGGLFDDSRKVNVAGDPKRTADNYRTVSRNADALLAQLTVPPDSPSDITAVMVPLKESLSLLGKSTSIMADYLDGKLTLASPNPDWVAKSQEYAAQGQARLKEAQ